VEKYEVKISVDWIQLFQDRDCLANTVINPGIPQTRWNYCCSRTGRWQSRSAETCSRFCICCVQIAVNVRVV